MKKTIGFVITAGHMDIEWYQPMDSYRFWTVSALEDLKNCAAVRDDFKTYVLDGQVYPLEIYLKSVPGDKDEMRRLVKDGKLTLGPFYTQFDEWLPSPESMVRNCLWGDRRAKKYGGCMKAGYLPDNFGHPLQLPQILKGFDIDSLMFMRGMPYVGDSFPDEFIFKGIDGSEIFGCHFRNSYSGAFDLFDKKTDPMLIRDVPYHKGYLSYEWHRSIAKHDNPRNIAEKLVESSRKMMPYYPSGVLPLISGHDHLPPQINIGDSVRIANEIQNDIEFVMGDAEEYVRLARSGMKSSETFEGELIGSEYQFVLLGALSTRTYIKRRHFGCEALLERYAEPLSAIATVFGYKPRTEILNDAWEKMLVNSAHDSIHGSSLDEVHSEMETRYSSVSQSCAGVVHEALEYMGDRMTPWANPSEHEILAYTPNGFTGNQLFDVWLPIGDRRISVCDSEGAPLNTYVEAPESPEMNSVGLDRNFPAFDPSLRRVSFVARANKNAQFDKFFTCNEKDTGSDLRGDNGFIENEHIKITSKGALIDLLDKNTGKIYYNLNLLEDEADAGDVWDFSPPWTPCESVLTSRYTFLSRLKELSGVKAVLEISGEISVPEKLCGDLRSENRVIIPITFEITLISGVRRADIKLTFDNTACDHRIRLRVPTYIKTDFVRCGTAFATIDRPIKRPEPKWRSANSQPETRLLPFRECAAVQEHGGAGIAVAFKGVYDYEAENDCYTGDAELKFTLLRSVGIMTRSYFKSRWYPAACSPAVPGAQCKGEQSVEWSYLPYEADETDKTPYMSAAESFLYPPVTHKVYHYGNEEYGDIPALFGVQYGGIRFSAFKPCQEGDGYILRLYESQGVKTRAEISISRFTRAYLCSMNEKDIKRLEIKDGKISLDFGPYKILTVKLFK